MEYLDKLGVICLVLGFCYVLLWNLTYVIPQPLLMILGFIVTFPLAICFCFLLKGLISNNQEHKVRTDT